MAWPKGVPLSPEHKAKFLANRSAKRPEHSKKMMGNTYGRGNLGKKKPDGYGAKMSILMKGRHHGASPKMLAYLQSDKKRKEISERQKGITWEEKFGIEGAAEMRRKVGAGARRAHLGKPKSLEWKIKHRGENHSNWQGGVSYDARSQDWPCYRLAAIRRDKQRCQDCKRKGIKMDVHHIIPWRICKKHEIDNLITLCRKCHMKWDRAFNRAM